MASYGAGVCSGVGSVYSAGCWAADSSARSSRDRYASNVSQRDICYHLGIAVWKAGHPSVGSSSCPATYATQY